MTAQEQTVVYPVYNGLYVNLTNRCSCACTFCIRQTASGVGLDGNGGRNNLWLDHEPSCGEVMAAIEAQDMNRYQELVFCGYGEPTCAFETLKQVAAEFKRRYTLPVRVNTNGQGSLINGRDIAPEFEGIVDTVSISLNTSSPEGYQELVRSRYGQEAFPAMLQFAREVRRYVPNVVMSTVDTTITHEDEARCQHICDELGVRYRIRSYAAS
ncbi:MAG: TatD family nuclease-associated radical SAM protein [Coriobacteriales bacterium]